MLDTDLGRVVVRDGDDADIVLFPAGTGAVSYVIRDTKPVAQSHDQFVQQLEDFIGACNGNHPPCCDAAQGFESVRLIEELYAKRKPLNHSWRDRGRS